MNRYFENAVNPPRTQLLENAVLRETVLYETQSQCKKGRLRSEHLLKTNIGGNGVENCCKISTKIKKDQVI